MKKIELGLAKDREKMMKLKNIQYENDSKILSYLWFTNEILELYELKKCIKRREEMEEEKYNS